MLAAFPLWVIVIDYVLGMVMWTLIGRAAMNIFLSEDSNFFFMRFFVRATNPILRLFAPITPGFLIDFLGNFFQYHLPGVQAYHLDVTPDPGVVPFLGTARGPVHAGYGELTIPQLLAAASEDGILFQP